MIQRVAHAIRKFTGSLSFKLSFYTALLMFLALLAFSYHSIAAREESLVRKMTEQAVKDTQVIRAAIWNGMMTNDREVIRQVIARILQTAGSRGGLEQINVYDARGRLRHSSQAVQDRGLRPAPGDPLLKAVRTDPDIRQRISRDGSVIQVVNPLLNEKSCSSAACHAHPESEEILGALEVRISLAEVMKEIYATKRDTIVFASLLFLLIGTISGLAVVRLVNTNIRKLKDNAAKMARGEYVPKGRAEGTDEMADLMRSFDRMSREINERTRELEESRRRYKTLFDEAPCYFTVVDRDYHIARVNNTFRAVFGDQVGKHCYVGYKGLTSRCEVCPVSKTFADGNSHQSEEVWKPGGRRVFVMVKTSPILDDTGAVTEVLEMSVDVTRLKELQFELEKKQQEYKYLFENAPCYLTIVDRDYRIVQTNSLFDRDFGESLRENCFRVYKGRDCRCENCPVEKTFEDGLSHTSEEIWQRNGEPTYVIVNTAPLTDDQGQILAVLEMSTNITEIKRLQGELILLGETIAGMSHNIKNILNGLQGGVYVVDSGLERGKGDRVQAGWQMVKNNVEKISGLVKGILYASKEREPEYQEYDPGKLLGEICQLYEEKARAGGIQLVREFEDEMGTCYFDPARLHNAVTNLISNAVEACASCSKTTCAGDRITVSGRIAGRRLIIAVSDNADGIPDEVKEKLFNKFYSTKGSKGTGLGLVITRKVVEEHRGTIKVESQPGRGTSFIIEIPTRMPQTKEPLRVAV